MELTPPKIATESGNLNFQISESVGEAIKEFNLIENKGSLNLLPLNVRQELKFIRQKPLLALAAILFAVFPWITFSGILKAKELKNISLNKLSSVAQPYVINEAAINSNKSKSRILSESISQVEGLVETKTNWIQFFADLQA